MRIIRFLLLMAAVLYLGQASAQRKSTPPNNLPPVAPDTNRILIGVNTVGGRTGNGEYFTLQQCIDYALIHQPNLNRAQIGVNIAKETNAVNLSGWLPQVTASGDAIHYIQQSGSGNAIIPSGSGGTTTTTTGTTGGTTGGTTTGGTTTGGTTTGGTTTGGSTTTGGTTTGGTTTTTTGTSSGVSTRGSSAAYSFIPQVEVSQAIFSPSLMYAVRTAPLNERAARQATDSSKIYLISQVSKAFYNVLLTLEQINVYKEDTARLGKNVRDTYHQYKGGIVDETDYLQATISLNNSIAQLKQANENVVPQFAALKQAMGFPPDQQFNVTVDTTQMLQSIAMDTTQQLAYEKRIEWQQLRTQKDLQAELTRYYRLGFLPTVSAFFNYNIEFESDRRQDLFSNSYPSSLVGLQFNIPIFTGFGRMHQVRRSRLEEQLLNWDQTDLKLQIYREYTTALANYKGNLFNFQILQKNVNMARRVYFVVGLQYKQGIVAYLNVITAEANLIQSEISYINALFQVLSSKIDLQKAMGTITY